jgi:fibronectin-binding autotransporter adhesin
MFPENERTARPAKPRSNASRRAAARPVFASSAMALAVAMLAAAPQMASAANECGAEAPGQDTLTCTATSYLTGITYAASNGLTLTLNEPAMAVGSTGVLLQTLVGPIAPELTINVTNVNSINSTGTAVSVVNQAVGGLAAINIDGGTITSTGAVNNAVNASGGGSGANAQVTLNGGQIVNASGGGGIGAQTAGANGTGNATIVINAGSVQASSTGAVASISGPNHTGTARIAMNGGSVLSGSTALAATTNGKGQAQVQMTGGTVTSSGANGDGIFVSSKSGTYAVQVTGGTVNGGSTGGAAIHTSAAAGGTVQIGAGAVINAGASGVALRDGDANRDGFDEINGNATITTAGTLNGAVLLGGGTDTLNIAGGAINGSISGDGADTLNFNLGAGSFVHGAAFAIGGMNAVVMNSGTVQLDSTLAGNTLTVNGGTLVLGGANSYTGGTFLNGGVLSVSSDANLGDAAGALNFDGGTLRNSADFATARTVVLGAGGGTFQADADLAVSSGITGAGSLAKTGAGTLTLSGANTYGGSTNVAQGTLRAGAANTFSAASAHNVAAGATLDLAGFNQAVASLANGGTVSLVGATAGTTLTVNGNYVGNNGVLRIGTALNAAGPSDRLVIDGGAATGKTSVQVTNLGGLGALTSGNGIEVITAQNGATTTAQTTKDAFALAGGHVDAGAYEYRLYAADAAGAGENWFLRSTTNAVTPPATPGAPGAPGVPGVPVITYRAEASLYAALPSQLRQGNLAMLGDVRKRVGDDDVKGSASTPTGSDRRAWARVLSTDIDIQQGGTVSPTSKGRLTGFQAGTDLLATSNVRAGLYVGQLDGDATVNGFASGVNNLRAGRNDLRSQYVGVYGTFTADSGLYADVVVQSGRHRYTVEPMLGGVGGKGNSLLGSIEVGQAFALGSSGWSIEPQLQLIHQHMDLSDSAILGAVVQPDADSGWIARAGLRVKGQIDTAIGALQPYGRFNVYRTSSGTDIARFVNGATRTDIAAPTGGTSTELAGGFTLALGQTTSLYGEIGKLWSSGGDAKVKSSINGSLGVRVKW